MENNGHPSLEYLSKKFFLHAQIAEENRKKWLDMFKENKPNEEVPEYLSDDFNLPYALSVICDELIFLRSKVERE